MTRIFVPQPIPEAAAAKLDTLGEVTTYPHVDRMIPESELLEAVRDKHILFGIGEIPFNERVFEAAKELQFVSVMHGSAKFIDFAAATRHNIPVSGQKSMTQKTTAEFTFALLMATGVAIAGGGYVPPRGPLAAESVDGFHGYAPLRQDARDRRDGPDRATGGAQSRRLRYAHYLQQAHPP